VLLASALVATWACAPSVSLTVDVLADPDADLGSITTFDMSSTTESDSPLLDKNLALIVADSLEARGLDLDVSPDALVTVDGGSTRRREYVPPRVLYWHHYEPGRTTRHVETVDGEKRVITVETRGRWYGDPSYTGGYTIVRHVHWIEIQIFERRDDEATLVWRGNAEAVTSERSLIRLARPMVDALLEEFPTPSGKPSRRSVRLRGE